MASTLTVRLFELLCLTLFIAGLVWVRRTGHPVYAGVYLGSTLLFGFDWIFNSNWLFRVEFDSKFINVWRMQGVGEPLAMALNYAFYFGAPVLSMGEAPAHPHNRRRETFVEVAGVPQPAPAPRFGRTPGAIDRPPPHFGQHTDDTLAEWGFTAGEREKLRQAGAIA